MLARNCHESDFAWNREARKNFVILLYYISLGGFKSWCCTYMKETVFLKCLYNLNFLPKTWCKHFAFFFFCFFPAWCNFTRWRGWFSQCQIDGLMNHVCGLFTPYAFAWWSIPHDSYTYTRLLPDLRIDVLGESRLWISYKVTPTRLFEFFVRLTLRCPLLAWSLPHQSYTYTQLLSDYPSSSFNSRQCAWYLIVKSLPLGFWHSNMQCLDCAPLWCLEIDVEFGCISSWSLRSHLHCKAVI